MSQQPSDLIYDEIMEKFQWFQDKEYNTDLLKNRPRAALTSEIYQQHEDMRWMQKKFWEFVKASNLEND